VILFFTSRKKSLCWRCLGAGSWGK